MQGFAHSSKFRSFYIISYPHKNQFINALCLSIYIYIHTDIYIYICICHNTTMGIFWWLMFFWGWGGNIWGPLRLKTLSCHHEEGNPRTKQAGRRREEAQASRREEAQGGPTLQVRESQDVPASPIAHSLAVITLYLVGKTQISGEGRGKVQDSEPRPWLVSHVWFLGSCLWFGPEP